jgi:hypothetical protein
MENVYKVEISKRDFSNTEAQKIDPNELIQQWRAAGLSLDEQAERMEALMNDAMPWVLVLARQMRGLAVVDQVKLVKRIARFLRSMPAEERMVYTRMAADEAGMDIGMFDDLLKPEPIVAAQEKQSEPPKNRFKLYTAEDALQPQEPIEWIIEGLFSAGSLSLVVGEPGSKKTWSMLDAAVAIARGDNWLGHEILPRSVLIIDEESGRRRISERIGKVLRGHGGNENTMLYYVSLANFDFSTSDDLNVLQSLIIETAAGFVLIDAMADIMPGKDENAVKDVQPIFLGMRRVAENTQAALALIHHSNKTTGQYRGSSAIKGAVDLMMQVESKPDSCDVIFKSEKVRDTPPFTFSGFAHFGDERFYMSETEKSTRIYLNKAQEAVIRYLESAPGATLEDVGLYAAGGAIPERTVTNACRSLAGDRMGFVKQSMNGGGRGHKTTWSLTEKGREYFEKL